MTVFASHAIASLSAGKAELWGQPPNFPSCLCLLILLPLVGGGGSNQLLVHPSIQEVTKSPFTTPAVELGRALYTSTYTM